MIEPVTDTPVAGFYAMRLIRGGPLVPVRIWHGLPIFDGEEQDRSPRWCCEVDRRTDREVNGVRELLSIDRAWPWCARHPISEAEYRFMVAHADWATEHQPGHPKAAANKAVNFNSLPLRF